MGQASDSLLLEPAQPAQTKSNKIIFVVLKCQNCNQIPGSTIEHIVAPASEYVPAAHGCGQADVDPSRVPTQPAYIIVQTDAPGFEYCPARHTDGHAEVAPCSPTHPINTI